MDIDHVVDVPDTPDRLTTEMSSQRSDVKEKNRGSSEPCSSGQHKFVGEGTKNHPLLIEIGSKSRSLRLPKRTGSFSKSVHPKNTKGVIEENSSYQIRNSAHIEHKQIESPLYNSTYSSSHGVPIDLTEMNLHRHTYGNNFPGGVRGRSQAEFRKKSSLANGASCSHGPKNFSTMLGNAGEGTDNLSRVGSTISYGKGVEFVDSAQNKLGNRNFLPINPIASPRLNKHKKLVQNGCISPNSIAKAKQLSGKDINTDAAVNNSRSSISCSPPPVLVDIAEDYKSHRRKGKEVLNHSCSAEESDFRDKHLSSRGFTSSNINAKEPNATRDVSKRIEESGGWISTRNQPGKMNLSSSEVEEFVVREMKGPRYAGQHNENRIGKREKQSSVSTADDCQKNLNLVSSASRPLRQSESNSRFRFGRPNGHRSGTNTFVKRKKQGSTLSNLGECSTSVSDDSEVVALDSSGDPLVSRSHSCSVKSLQSVIGDEELFPEIRHTDHDEDARVRQVEADELLARELQEQLYSEGPVLGAGEFDAYIALALQRQDDSGHTFSGPTHPVFDARGSMISNLHRRSQSRSSLNPPRGGAQTRPSTLGRMTRVGSRFLGHAPTFLSSRGRTSLFPANMDIDTRMHILGELEAFSDLEVGPGILQNLHDFNENDYEMLLALDENNDQHCGASVHQINSLPQSTVQSDTFEEACVICLETPTTGDTIRHLPCLHKFHKDCIDTWLRRRRSCPVCKSSIT